MLKKLRIAVVIGAMFLPVLMGQGCPADGQLTHIPGSGAKNGTGPGTGGGTGGGGGPIINMTLPG